MPSFKPASNQQELPFSLQRKRVLRVLQTTTTHQKHLLRVLDDHIGNKSSWECWLSVDTICREMCCKKRTAERAIADCIEAGWIIVLKRPSRHRGCNTYLLRRAEMWEAVGLDGSMIDGPEPNPLATRTGQNVSLPSATVADRPVEPIRHSGGSISDPSATVAGRLGEPIRHGGGSIALQYKNEASNHGNGGRNTNTLKWEGTDEGFLKTANPRKTFRNVTRRDLNDPEAIARLFDQAVSQGQRRRTEKAEIDFFILCAHCARAGETPAALLTSCVFQGKTAIPTLPDEDAGRRLLAAWRNLQPRSPAAVAVTTVAANALKSTDSVEPTDSPEMLAPANAENWQLAESVFDKLDDRELKALAEVTFGAFAGKMPAQMLRSTHRPKLVATLSERLRNRFAGTPASAAPAAAVRPAPGSDRDLDVRDEALL